MFASGGAADDYGNEFTVGLNALSDEIFGDGTDNPMSGSVTRDCAQCAGSVW